MREITLNAVGDICLETRGERTPFHGVEEVLGAGDVVFGNLETVLVDEGEAVRKAYLLRTSPENVEHLLQAGFDVANVANNHTLDLGQAALGKTLETLRRSGIAVAGNRNSGSGSAHTVVERRGMKIGFVGYCEYALRWSWRPRGESDRSEIRILGDVRSARAACDYLVVSLHWGVEGAVYPSPLQIRTARRLVDAGADIVLGHHPHVVQGVERYRGGLIAYSLGNFQFPSEGGHEDVSFVLSVRLGRGGVRGHRVTPVRILPDWTPVLLTGGERDAALAHVARISEPVAAGRICEEWWFSRIAVQHLKGNLDAWLILFRRYGWFELLRLARWCLRPFNLRCLSWLLRGSIRECRGGRPSGLARAVRVTGRPKSRPGGAGFASWSALEVVQESRAESLESWLRLGGASPFVSPAWLEAFRGPGRSPVYFRFVCRGETVGAIGGLLTRRYARILPGVRALHGLFFYSGPVVSGLDGTLIARCMDRIVEFAESAGIPSVVFRSWDYPFTCFPDHEFFRMETRQEYMVDLRGGPERLRGRLNRNRRWRIRKARRASLVCHLDRRRHLLPVLIDLLERTRSARRKKGYESYNYFYMKFISPERIERLLESGMARIGYAERCGEIQAANLIVSNGLRAYAVLVGKSRQAHESGAGDLLMWHVMRTLAEEGVESLNLGGNPASGDAGLKYYKTSLGAVPHTCTGGRAISPRAALLRMPGKLLRGIHGHLTGRS